MSDHICHGAACLVCHPETDAAASITWDDDDGFDQREEDEHVYQQTVVRPDIERMNRR